jgi:hypothetical protein
MPLILAVYGLKLEIGNLGKWNKKGSEHRGLSDNTIINSIKA